MDLADFVTAVVRVVGGTGVVGVTGIPFYSTTLHLLLRPYMYVGHSQKNEEVFYS